MTGPIAAIRSAAKPLLWLDDTAYSERLLAAGRTPWLDGAGYVAFRRKAQGLLKADLAAVPLEGFMRAWVEGHPGVREAMRAKKRVVFPARTLLTDQALRAHLVETLAGLRAAFPSTPLVLAMPSPRALVVNAWRMAFSANAEEEVGGDEADACAVYLAEFLRSFGACGVDGLLLEESAEAEPADAGELEWYQPVINIAAHYRWDLGLRLPEGIGYAGEASSMQFVIAPCQIAGTMHIPLLTSAFREGAVPQVAASSKVRFAVVPADAAPEHVLARLAELRTE